MKRKTCFFLFAMVFTISIFGQTKYAKPNFEQIQNDVKEVDGKYYLPNLLKRYNANDTTLSFEELQHLYYGYTMLNDYFPISYTEKRTQIEALKGKDLSFSKSVEVCNDLLKKDLFDLDFYNIKSVCLYEIKKGKMNSEANFDFYYNLCKVIKSSGTGKDANSPIYIINQNHIDFVCSLLGFQTTGIVAKKDGLLFVEIKENVFQRSGMYFEISAESKIMLQKVESVASDKLSKQNSIVKKEEVIIAATTTGLKNKLNTKTTSTKQSEQQQSIDDNLHASTVENEPINIDKNEMVASKIQNYEKTNTVSNTLNTIEERNKMIEKRLLLQNIAKEKYQKELEEKYKNRDLIIDEKIKNREKVAEERKIFIEKFMRERDEFLKNKKTI